MSHVCCPHGNSGQLVPMTETRSLKMFPVLRTLLLQMPSKGYGTAAGTSDKPDLGRGLGPPAQSG